MGAKTYESQKVCESPQSAVAWTGLFTKFLRCLCFAPASRRTRARESGCLPTPRIEAAHKVIVHEQLADDTKDKEDKGISFERTAEADGNE